MRTMKFVAAAWLLLFGAAAGARAQEPAESEDYGGQVLIQEPDEDVAGFVEDYIRKEIELKKFFFVADPVSGAALRLVYERINQKPVLPPDGTRVFEAYFSEPALKKRYRLLFHVKGSQWGGLDIFRIEVKEEKRSPAAERKK